METAPPKTPRLLDAMRDRIRMKHFSYRTEQVYIGWAKRYILFHGKRHPSEMGKLEIEAFLSWLATERNVSASTQNQARAAIIFLYNQVIGTDLPYLSNIEQAKAASRLPVVLTMTEVQQLLSEISGTWGLFARLLYGTGMRLTEGLRLRVKDVDLMRAEILVREGKGFKDRVTVLPQSLIPLINEHIERVRRLHRQDLEEGFGEVYLPYAIERKYPGASRSWGCVSDRRIGANP